MKNNVLEMLKSSQERMEILVIRRATETNKYVESMKRIDQDMNLEQSKLAGVLAGMEELL